MKLFSVGIFTGVFTIARDPSKLVRREKAAAAFMMNFKFLNSNE
jgi:hypothetical protein